MSASKDHALRKRGRAEHAPRWARWIGYVMCGWSLLFAAMHFASGTGRSFIGERPGLRAEPLAWLLCAGMLGVIALVTTLALLQERSRRFPIWLVPASSLAFGLLLFGYVTFSFLRNGAHWVLAPGVLCLVGAVVALALTKPWGRQVPRWLLLLFAWLGGAILTLHALYGFVVHGMVAAGLLSWTQVQRLAGAPLTPISAEALRELIMASMLIWNPWFLLGGLLFLTLAAYASWHQRGPREAAGAA